jgi:hypothetical protein
MKMTSADSGLIGSISLASFLVLPSVLLFSIPPIKFVENVKEITSNRSLITHPGLLFPSSATYVDLFVHYL